MRIRRSDENRKGVGARVAPVAVLASVVGFVALDVPAMWLYPGGTWWDKGAVGVRFWQNYLCDLEWHIALNGQDNTLGSQFARAALLALVAGLAPFWVIVPELFGGRGGWPRVGRAVRALGLTSVAGTVAVAFMPSDRFGALHGLMVIVSGVPGLTAAGLAVAGLVAPGPGPPLHRWLGGLGVLMLAASLANFVIYAIHWFTGVETPPLLPAVQKVSLILLMAWMSGVALRVIKLRPSVP
jgi:hypothetical protein